MSLFLEYSIVGLAAGGIYALVALGFVLIFKATGLFNFAMGELMMFGAFLFFAFSQQAGWHWAPALVGALALSIALALLIERAVLRQMIGQSEIVLIIITVGLGSILKGIAGIIWGPEIRQIPGLLPRTPIFLGDILIPGTSFWGFVIAIAVVSAFLVYFRFSRAGVALRATASSDVNAYSMGIDVRRVAALVWIGAAVTATMCGVVLGAINGIEPHLGDVALVALAVLILGGLDSMGGVIVGGLAIGWLQSMTGAYLGGEYREAVPYVAVLLVLLVRPYGLFGKKHIERI
jgi:branched-chain amino acid transport system permease protein